MRCCCCFRLLVSSFAICILRSGGIIILVHSRIMSLFWWENGQHMCGCGNRCLDCCYCDKRMTDSGHKDFQRNVNQCGHTQLNLAIICNCASRDVLPFLQKGKKTQHHNWNVKIKFPQEERQEISPQWKYRLPTSFLPSLLACSLCPLPSLPDGILAKRLVVLSFVL